MTEKLKKETETKTEVRPEVKAPDPAQLKKEFDAYKIALRNKLGKSINFAAVMTSIGKTNIILAVVALALAVLCVLSIVG